MRAPWGWSKDSVPMITSYDNTTEGVLVELARKSSDGVIIFDNFEDRITFINSAASRITGFKNNTPLSDIQRIFDALPVENKRHIRNGMDKMQLEGSCPSVEFQFSNSDKEYFSICASAYKLGGGKITIVFLQDTTKSKEYENYLIEFGTKKNTTLASIVHFISGAVSLMKNLSVQAGKSILSDNISSTNIYLDLIEKNSNHCLDVIKDVLREEHIRSETIPPVKNLNVDVVEKVGYIVDNLRAAHPGRDFLFNRPNGALLADVDEIKMLQIVNNFAFNAIKFSSKEKGVTIDIGERQRNVVIKVSDAGIGIPVALQPFIFDRNTIAGRVGLNGEPSFGIGLSISKSLAAVMNGGLEFESKEGVGSTFCLFFPKR